MGKNNTVGKLIFTTAFLLGGISVGWMGAVFINTNALALTITLVIGGVYGIGAIELFQFRYATASLTDALLRTKEKVAVLEDWLHTIDASLHNSVRLRIQGERVGLPAPILTPYFVGLLVMLGLLGTFVGMVATLKGAVIALEGTSELEAIRAGLAAPIKGLGLAFGTSIAGVAASAMLGLMSTLSKRDRVLATRHLDSRAATVFQDFSLAHSQQETFRALQIQTRALPEVAGKLQAMADKLEQVGETLIATQDSFHTSVGRIFSDLAVSMDKTHRESLAENVRLAGESIQPIVNDVMNTVAEETRNIHKHLMQAAGEHLNALSGQFADTSTQVTESLKTALADQHHSNHQLTEHMRALLHDFKGQFEHASASMGDAFTTITASAIERQQTSDEKRLILWTAALENTQKESAWQFTESSERFSSELRQVVDMHQETFETTTKQFVSFGRALEASMTRLIQTAEHAPRAAIDVISHLRREASQRAEQDTRQLEEQRRTIKEIDTLSRSLAQTSTNQQAAIEQLVQQSRGMLENVAGQFTDRMGAEATRFSEVAENFAAGAVEMASLGDAFSTAVILFNASNEQMIQSLSGIEASLEKAASRSDEQLGYYVAQAREIIDHCMLSQKEIFEDLQKLKPNNEIRRAG